MNQEGEQNSRKRGGNNGNNRGRRGGNNRGGGTNGGGGNYGGRYGYNKYSEQSGSYGQRQPNYQERERDPEETGQYNNPDEGQTQYRKTNQKRNKKDYRNEKTNGQNQRENGESKTEKQETNFQKSEVYDKQHEHHEDAHPTYSQNTPNQVENGGVDGERKAPKKKRPRMQDSANNGAKDLDPERDRERGNQKGKDWVREEQNQKLNAASSEFPYPSQNYDKSEYQQKDPSDIRNKKHYENQQNQYSSKQGPYRKKYPQGESDVRTEAYHSEQQGYSGQNQLDYRGGRPKGNQNPSRQNSQFENDSGFESYSQIQPAMNMNPEVRSNPYGIPINNSNEVSAYGGSMVQSIHSSRFTKQESDQSFPKLAGEKRYDNTGTIRGAPIQANLKDLGATNFGINTTNQQMNPFPIAYNSPQSSKHLFQKTSTQDQFESSKIRDQGIQIPKNYPIPEQLYSDFNTRPNFDQSNKKKGKYSHPYEHGPVQNDPIKKIASGADDHFLMDADYPRPNFQPLDQNKKEIHNQFPSRQYPQMQPGFQQAPVPSRGDYEQKKPSPTQQQQIQIKKPKVEKEETQEIQSKNPESWNPYSEFASVKPKTFNCPVETHSVQKYLFEVNNEYYRQSQLTEFEPYYNHEEAKDLVSKDRAFRGKIKFKQGLNSFAVIQSDDFVKNVFCTGMGINRAIHGSEVIFCPFGNDWQKFLVINQTEASKNYEEIERQEVLSEEQNYYNFMKKRYSEDAITDDGPSHLPTNKIFAQVIYIEKNPLQEAPFVLRLKKDKQGVYIGHNIQNNKYPPFKIILAEKSPKLEMQMNSYYLARFEKWPHNEKQPTASLISNLGQEGLLDTEIEAILSMNDIQVPTLSDAQIEEFKQSLNFGESGEFEIKLDDIGKREDLRSNLTFTVNSRDDTGYQQAFSLSSEDDGSCTISVHIVDASFYIEKDSPLDILASKKARSLKLPGKSLRMLPECINQDICSFELAKDRLSISLFYRISSQGVILPESTRLCRSVINCKSCFNFEVMEAIFMGQISTTENSEFQDLKVSGCTISEVIKYVNTLKSIFHLRRNKKLESSINFDVDTSSEKIFTIDPSTQKPVSWKYRKTSDAEKVVNDCLNLANLQIAEYLSKNCPKLAIFFSQEEPLKEPMKKFGQMIPKIVSMIPSPIIEALRFKPQIFQSINLNQFNLVRFFDKSSILNLTPSSLPTLTSLFNLTPELYRNYFDHTLKKVLNPVNYQVNDKSILPDISLKHYTHNLKLVSQFTKPLDRYVDLVTHRILGWIMDKKDPNTFYTNHEISVHCLRANKAKMSTSKSMKQIQKLYYGFWMQSLPGIKQVDKPTNSAPGYSRSLSISYKFVESEALVVELGRCLIKLWVFELNTNITLNLARDYQCQYFQKEMLIKVPNNFVSSETELIQGVSPVPNITSVKSTTENLKIWKDLSFGKKPRSKKVVEDSPNTLTLTVSFICRLQVKILTSSSINQ